MRSTNIDSALLRALEALHRDAEPATCNDRLVSAVGSLISADVTSLNGFSERAELLGIDYVSPTERITPALQLAFAQWYHQHPALVAALNRGHVVRDYQEPARLSDFTTTRRLKRLALFGEFFGPVGVDQQLLVSVRDGPRAIVVALNRLRVDFSDIDVLRVRRLQPFLQQATHAAGGLRAYRRAVSSENGVIVATRQGQCIEVEPRAAELLLLHAQACRLSTSEPVIARLLTWASGEATRLDTKVRAQAQLNWNSSYHAIDLGTMRLNATACPSLTVRLFAGPEPTLMRMFVKADTAVRVDGIVITPREREILEHLTAGRTNAQIAQLLGTKANTVRTQVEHIRDKFGVRTRLAAARLWEHLLKDV